MLWLLVLAPLLGCKGLINVNGKPLGGGNSSSSSSGGGNSSSGGGDSSDNERSSSGDDHAKASEPQPLTDDEMYVVKAEGMNDAAVHKPGRIPWCAAG